MKKVLLIAIFSFLINWVWGQTSTPGVTVITHGFTPFFSDIDVWKAHAIALREYAKLKTGKGATVFVNVPETGFWEILDATTVSQRGVTYNVYKQSKVNIANIDKQGELIFLYNWKKISDNGAYSKKIGYLEAGADNLFAMLSNPIVTGKSFEPTSLHSIIYPNSTSTMARLIQDRPTHFIGHSRGTILLTQVINRFYKYYQPNISIKQFTTLDPHPAAVMGDVESPLHVGLQGLPYINGNASNCTHYANTLCDNGNNVSLNIPENVDKADNFFRRDFNYEADLEFDGISSQFGNKENEMDNSRLGHSDVHNWYWGTFDILLPNTFQNDNNYETNMPKVIAKSNWYTSGIYKYNVPFTGRTTEGFYFSRLGGGTYGNRVKSTTDNSQKRKINVPFNNDFSSSNGAGWQLNGGSSSYGVAFNYKNATLFGGYYISHSFFYFPDNFQRIMIKAKYRFLGSSGRSLTGDIHIVFRDVKDNKLFSKSLSIPASVQNAYADYPIDLSPNELLMLRGKVGRMGIKANDNIDILDIKEFSLVDQSNSNLRVIALQNANNNSNSTYFDFPVTYNVNPNPLIKGVRPSSFNATIQNTLPSTWNGTLTMTWRKVTDSGKGIPLVSKGVSLAPNATVTLDRGTQQIISEAGEYVLAIYANNDTDPIDLYYFYVEEPDEVVSQTVSITPSSSNYGFGNTLVSGSASQTFTIKNTSTSNVSISNYALTGAGFVQGTTTCCGTLAPNQSYTVNVIFQPSAVSAYNGNLQINGTFDGAPLNITLSGTGYQTTPPAVGCLESSIATVNIITGNTDAPRQQFFTLSNTSQSGSVTVNNIQFTGADAQYFSYDSQLFSTPSTINPAISTGFMVKVNGTLTQNRNYNASLSFSTSSPSCPTLSIPVVAINQNSTVSWVGPITGYTAEYANGFARFDLQWQGYVQGASPIDRAVQIQYSIAGGTWTHVSQSSIDCTKGHSNDQVNTDYFDLTDANSVGKKVQFRIKPCNTNVPWQYTGTFHVIESGFKPLQVISPNGYEVLTGGTSYDIKWKDLLGYQSVNLAYSTDNGSTWITIASNVSGEATYYRWNVPTGIKNSNCLVKVTSANISDQSDRTFTIQPALATPITYSELSINPIGCGTTPNGSVNFRLLGGQAPYYVLFVEAGLTMTTINASYVTGGMNGLDKGTHTVVITDANFNKASYTFYVPEKRLYTVTTTIENDICSGSKGKFQVNLNGDFPYPPVFTFSKNGQQIYQGVTSYISNLAAGLYSIQTKDNENCINEQVVFVDTSPGTYFPITPTVTNTSCSGTTGAISLNIGNAQSPTYLWSNGATTQNLTALAAGQYSVNVTDATGCMQNQKNEVFEEGGVTENRVGTFYANSNFNNLILFDNKIYFSENSNNSTGYSRLGIFDLVNNTFDNIQFQSLYFPTRIGVAPYQIEITASNIYVNLREDRPDGRVETHFLKIDKSTKQIISRVIVLFPLSGTYQHLKMIFANNKLYALRGDSKMDIIDFSNNSINTINLTGSFNNFIKDNSLNKMYLTGAGGIAEFDLSTNTTTRTGTTQVLGNMINQIGSELYIVGEISGDLNTYIEKIGINNFLSIQKYVLKNKRFFGRGRSLVKDNRYVYIPTDGNRTILVFDIINNQVEELLSNFNNIDLVYSSSLNKLIYNGTGSGIFQIDNNKFDYTTTKTDASCGLNNGSITLTIPNDGKIYTYLWSNGATTRDVTGLSSGSYIVTVTQTGGCALKKTIVIAQLSTGITATLSPNSGTLCPSQTITLQSTAGTSYVWYKDNVIISGATSQTYNVSLAGVYKVVVTNSSGCSATSNNSTITATPSSTANFTNVISGNVVTFTNTSTNGNQYLWNFGDATTDTQFSPIKTYSGGGGTFTVTLRVTNSCGVFNDVSKSVTVSCTNMYTLKTGNWNDITVWSCGRVPTSTDIITVKANHFVTIPASYTANAKSVIFEAIGGKFIYAANTSKICLSCPATIPTNGLVIYLPFNGNANDASGNNNNGVISGATLGNDRFGVANKAYRFNDGNRINVTNSASLNLSNAFTFSVWVNMQSNTGRDGNGAISTTPQQCLFTKNCDNGQVRSSISPQTNGTYILQTYANAGDQLAIPFQLNQWKHIVSTYDGTTLKQFVDGNLVSTKAVVLSLALSNSYNLVIGNMGCYVYYFNGFMDEFRMYNRGLSNSEVLDIYNGEKP